MKKLGISIIACVLVIFVAAQAQLLGGATTASAFSLGEGKVLAVQAAKSGVEGASNKGSLTEAVAAQVSTGFTYQGQLKDGGQPANGQYDFRFTLFDASTGNGQIGSPVTAGGQQVADGLITVTLDFGASAFKGDARYLQIEVKPAGGPTYTALTPRQPITPTPYALFALKTQGYKNVVTVAGAGGDFTSIQAALNSITDNSATNRYLVWVGPGTYTERVTMKPYVDIEGSGEGLTKISFVGSGGINTGTVIGASNAELRFLSVERLSTSDAVAIYIPGQSPRITHVTATVSTPGTNGIGIYITNAGAPTLSHVTVISTDAMWVDGIFSSAASPLMSNVTVTASGGQGNSKALHVNGGGTVRVEHSTLISSGDINYTVATSGSTVLIAASRMDGGSVLNVSGTLTCAGVYNGNFTFFANTCP